jgi:O-antigen/teichoic acid export membrane protein
VPLAIGYLGNERFGVWATITAIIGMLAFSDLGMGNGMISELADAHGRDDRDRARRIVSSATLILFPVALAAGVIFAVIYPFVSWPAVFNAQSPQTIAESGPSMAVCVALFLIGLPLNVIQATHLGYQEGFMPNVVQAAISVVGVIGLVIAIWCGLGLVGISALWIGASILVRGINGFYLFGYQRPWLLPTLREFDWTTSTRLLKVSFFYMVVGMSIAVGYTSDSLVLTQLIGPNAVTEYNVPFRLFSIVTVVLGFFLLPLWPAYAEAAARGDVRWVKITLRRSILLSLAINLTAAVALVFAGKWLIQLWVRDAVSPTTAIMLAFAAYLIVNCLHAPLSMLLNGLSIIRFQFACWVSMAVVNLVLSIILTKRFGVPGVVWGTVIANFVCFVVPSAWYARKHLNELSRRAIDAAAPATPSPLEAPRV